MKTALAIITLSLSSLSYSVKDPFLLNTPYADPGHGVFALACMGITAFAYEVASLIKGTTTNNSTSEYSSEEVK